MPRKAKKTSTAKRNGHELPLPQPQLQPPIPPTDSEIAVSNTAFILVGQVATGILSLILIRVIALYMHQVGLGLYSTAIAISAILMQVLDFGIPTYAVREIARRKESANDFVSNIMGLRAVLSVGMVAGSAALLLFFLSNSRITAETAGIMGLAVLATALSFLAEPLRAALLAFEKHSYYSGIWIAERLIFISFALTMLFLGKGLLMVMLGFAISALAALIINAAVVWKKFTRFSIRLDSKTWPKWADLIKKGAPFWLSALFMTLLSKIDTPIISLIKGAAAAGIYSAASKIMDLFTLLPLTVSLAFYPTLSRLYKHNSKDELTTLFKKAFYYLILIAIPMAVAFTLLSDRIIMFLGGSFSQAATVLQILAWAELFIFLNYLLSCMLNSIDKQIIFTLSTGAYATLNILLNLMVIPKFGYIGAAFVALTTQFMQTATLYYFCSKSGYGLNIPKLVFKPIVATAAMGAAIILLSHMHLLITAPLAAISYLAILIALKGLTKEDFTIIKSLLARVAKRKF